MSHVGLLLRSFAYLRASIQLGPLHVTPIRRQITPLPCRRLCNTGASSDTRTDKKRVKEDDDDDDVVERVVKFGGKRTLLWYEHQLQKLSDARNVSKAIELVDVQLIKEDKLVPSYYVLHKLIAICGKAGYAEKAFQILQQMKRLGYKPKGKTYTSLFNACAECPEKVVGLERAYRLREMLSGGGAADGSVLDLNIITYRAMIRAFGRCGDIHTAFELMDEVVQKFKIADTDCFSSLLHACIEQKEGGLSYAIQVWHQMLAMKVKPDIRTVNLLLRVIRDCSDSQISDAVAKAKTLAGPLQLLPAKTSDAVANSELTSLSVESKPAASVSAATSRLALFGGINGVHQLCSSLDEPPNLKTFSMLIQMCDIAEEDKILETIANYKVDLDVNFFNLLIAKMNRQKRFEDVQAVLQKMEERSIAPNLHTYGALAMGCLNQKSASNLLQQLANRQLMPSIELFNILLYNTGLNFPYKKFVISQMSHAGIRPSKNSVLIVERSLARAKKLLMSRQTDEESQIDPAVLKQKLRQRRSLVKNYDEFSKFYTSWLRRTPVDSADGQSSTSVVPVPKVRSGDSEDVIVKKSVQFSHLKFTASRKS